MSGEKKTSITESAIALVPTRPYMNGALLLLGIIFLKNDGLTHLNEFVEKYFHFQFGADPHVLSVLEHLHPPLSTESLTGGDANQMIVAHGFDRYFNDGSGRPSEHWELLFDDKGNVVDAKVVPGHSAFGAGPFLVENPPNTSGIEHDQWGNVTAPRPEPVTDAQHDAATEWYKAHGAHQFTPEDMTPQHKAEVMQTIQSRIPDKKIYGISGIHGETVTEAILKYGGYTDSAGQHWQLWVNDKGVTFFIQNPSGGALYPSYDNNFSWHLPGGEELLDIPKK